MKRVLRHIRPPGFIAIMLLAAARGTFAEIEQLQSAVEVLRNAPSHSLAAQVEGLSACVAAVRCKDA